MQINDRGRSLGKIHMMRDHFIICYNKIMLIYCIVHISSHIIYYNIYFHIHFIQNLHILTTIDRYINGKYNS